MTQNIKKSVALTKYLVSLPRTSYLFFVMLLLGIVFGILVNFDKYIGIDLFTLGIIDGLFVLTIPALLSALTVKLMLRQVDFRKIVATTLIGEILYALTYLISFGISIFNPEYSQVAIFIGSAFVFVLWYYIARIIFGVKWKAFIFSISQLIFHAFFLISSQMIFFEETTEDILFKFYLSAFLLLGAIYLLFRIINAPMKRLFGYSSMDAFSMFMAQWLYGKKDIEEAFKEVGETCKTFLSLIVFERKNDKKIFLTPYVHYGPFGNLGGSEFSYLLSKKLQDKYNAQTFVFHGTVTHDLNPSSSSEMSKIVKACDDCMSNYSAKSVNASYSYGKYEECFADSLILGDNAFVSLSRAPKVTEDINFGLGLALTATAEKYVKSATVIDQHNAETGEITSFEPGSIVGYNYLQALENSLSKIPNKVPLKTGFSEFHPDSPVLGRAGIKIAVFSTKPNYALILIDSNGISPEFRETIMNEIEKLGKENKIELKAGIFTTDTHKVNTVKGIANPLTHDNAMLIQIKQGVLEAVKDMQATKVYFSKKWFEIDVLGAKQSIELVSVVNSIIAVAKVAAPIIIFSAVVAIVWILSTL